MDKRRRCNMALRTKDSVYGENFHKKDKSFMKTAMLILDNYDEAYLVKERDRLNEEINILSGKIVENDFNGTNALVKAKIAKCKKQLEMFDYLII